MIDTHCHLTFDHYADRVADVLEDAAQHGVAGAITVSTTSTDVKQCIALAESFDNVWCTSGVHPLNCDQPIHWPTIVEAAKHERCLAWGELGLDHHYDEPKRDLQDHVLEEQLTIIEESSMALPIVVHCREAFDDLIPVLRNAKLPPHRFVFHCFTGNADDARRVLDFGAWISFTGVVTFKNAKGVRDAARLVPNDRMMIETDAPFLTPEPFRKIHPNSPRYAIETARFVAQWRGTDWEAFHETINRNTAAFYGIPMDRCRISAR